MHDNATAEADAAVLASSKALFVFVVQQVLEPRRFSHGIDVISGKMK